MSATMAPKSKQKKLRAAKDAKKMKKKLAVVAAGTAPLHEESVSDASSGMTDNEGESSDIEEETPADYTVRGSAGLITAACPRHYPRDIDERKRLGIMIPQDFEKPVFIDKIRRLININTNRTLQKAYCVDEPHKRFRKSTSRRERHKHVAFLLDAPFAHKQAGR